MILNQAAKMRGLTMSSVDAGRFLCFSLGDESFALPLLQVKEVIGMADIRPVPLSPKYFVGILNLRGEVISVVDLRVKLSIGGRSEKKDENSIIILELDGTSIGVIVDSVDSVTSFNKEQISDPPIRDGATRVDYITAIAKQEKSMTLIVDLFKVFDVEEMKRISSPRSSGQEKAA